MLARSILAAALALGFSSAAQAQQQYPGVTLYDSKGAVIGTAANPLNVTGGTGGGGSANAATTSNATDGQATSATNQSNVVYNYLFDGTTWSRMRGTGGAVFALAGQYNATLPTLTSGATGYLAVDSNGRLIPSPGASVVVSSGSVSLTGTLPSFATTQTFNVGTTNGLALDATLTARFGTLGQKAAAGSAPVVLASDQTLPLPTGASTAANQTSEITSLQAIQQRAIVFPEQTNGSVAASGTLNGGTRDVGAAPAYSRFNVVVTSTQAGTLNTQGSNDNFATVAAITSDTLSAGNPKVVSIPLMYRYNRYVFINGSTTTAATVNINTSYTAN